MNYVFGDETTILGTKIAISIFKTKGKRFETFPSPMVTADISQRKRS